MSAAVTVVGIGADGCAGLSARAAGAVARADVLVGGVRHLAFFPQFEGRRIAVAGGPASAFGELRDLSAEGSVCVLASGDPMFFGIGSRIIEAVGAGHVEILPHPSSVQWAFARVKISWEDARFISVHGRSIEGLAARVRHERKVGCITDPTHSPAAVARQLLDYGDGAWQAWVCEEVGGPGERIRAMALAELADCKEDLAPLCVLILVRDAAWRHPPVIPFGPESDFARRMPDQGLITKREVRLLSLAALELRRDSIVWDVGAGSGAVSVEAARLATEGEVYAIEADATGAAFCRDNSRHMGADNVRVVTGLAPGALAGLPDPDAVFVGGSKGQLREILAVALDRLVGRGRLVVNAITLDTIATAYAFFKERGLDPEVIVVNVARGLKLNQTMRYDAQNPVHILAVTKPEGRGRVGDFTRGATETGPGLLVARSATRAGEVGAEGDFR